MVADNHIASPEPTKGRDLLGYFNNAATGYREAIEPAFAPLAQNLIQYAAIETSERVLDLGTGSGAAVHEAANYSDRVLAVDFAWEMVRIVRLRGYPSVLGDMHRLPVTDHTFSVVLAAFAFNSTDYVKSFAEARRVLQHGGRLVFSEWGTEDEIGQTFTTILNEYRTTTPAQELIQMRRALDIPLPWDTLDTSDDIVQALDRAGFEAIQCEVINPPVVFSHYSQYVRYKLAWPTRRAELEAMDAEVRRLFLSDLDENIGAYARPDGSLVWQPNVVRLRAVSLS